MLSFEFGDQGSGFKLYCRIYWSSFRVKDLGSRAIGFLKVHGLGFRV